MHPGEEFDAWASAGRDRGMAERHWHTAKDALAMMPVAPGDLVLDLGCGTGYAARALAETRNARSIGLDGSREMAQNARTRTDDTHVEFVLADFHGLPFPDDRFDHGFSMEALYYATDPYVTLRELKRILTSGGTFYCAVNFYRENHYSAECRDAIDLDMVWWSASDYRDAFREANLHVAGQTTIPDREIDIPPADAFPYEGPVTNWETRAEMRERYRELGTLLTVGVVP